MIVVIATKRTSAEEKIANLHNFRKEDNLLRYTQILEKFFLEISVPFDFHPGISWIFGWKVRFSEIQQFPDFLELFLGNFCTIWPRFENFGIFGRMVSAPSLHFVPVLQSAVCILYWPIKFPCVCAKLCLQTSTLFTAIYLASFRAFIKMVCIMLTVHLAQYTRHCYAFSPGIQT